MASEAKRPRLEEDTAVTTFRRYLRINTSQPNPDYGMITYSVQPLPYANTRV